MDKYEIVKGYNETKFKAVTGVTLEMFNAMLEALKAAYEEAHRLKLLLNSTAIGAKGYCLGSI